METKEILGLFLNLCFCLSGIFSTDTTELILFSSVMQIELKGTVSFPLSWRQRSSATLTVSQDIKNVLTEVLWINDTDVRISNNWQNKAVVTFHNESEAIYLNVTLAGVTTEDEGKYWIKLREDNEEYTETVHNTGNFEIEIYALPIYIKILADQTEVDEHTEVKVTCSGNIGRPAGELRLLQSAYAYPDFFNAVDKVLLSNSPDIQDSMLPNGTYYIQQVFLRNMSRIDNGTSFKCDISQYVTGLTTRESDILSIHVNSQREECPAATRQCLAAVVVQGKVSVSSSSAEFFEEQETSC